MNERSATPDIPSPPHRFTVPLSATRRGARLARLLATEQLLDWGLQPDPARLVVAELAANAVLHGRVAGRGFRLTLSVMGSGTLRIEVADTRGDRLPAPSTAVGEGLPESGHGLRLVEELADRWGVRIGPVPAKTVWAELDSGVSASREPSSPEPGNTGAGGAAAGAAGGQGVKNSGKEPSQPAKPLVRHPRG
ncbi:MULTISPECIES: ATP-binding protein [Streptomyces]|uniref:ATP-binding protein n=1 Tax=Streptomyces TaxID=1883 RepID=UPI001E3A0D29|nr:ATP-binding protein [Streptomyces ruber]